MSKEITVIKKDGKNELFNPQKILRIAQATGLTDKEAEVTQKNIVSRVVEESKKDKKISSQRIRDIFIEELENQNEYAAGLFKWFEKNKVSST